MKMLKYDGKMIAYNLEGDGPCVILLHGYLESKEVWDSLKPILNDYTLLTVDLPGHGDSELVVEKQTVEQMAGAIKAILDKEQISSAFIYGHSMGGYVAEAFERQWPEMVRSIGLIHSTIYADTEEKRNNRKREIELIRKGKKAMVVSSMLPNIVANQNIDRCRIEVEEIVDRAKMFASKGIIAVLNAMMQRPLHLINDKIPFHLIAGDQDNFIPMDVYNKMAEENPHIHMDVIKDCGHASIIEFPEETGRIINKFLSSVN